MDLIAYLDGGEVCITLTPSDVRRIGWKFDVE